MRVWLKIKDLGLRRFQFLVACAKVPFWYIYLSHSHESTQLGVATSFAGSVQ